MTRLFIQLLNLSIAAGWLILAVALLRLVLKKAPRSVFCILWALVAVRLVCPFSLKTVLSLIPSRETVPVDLEYMNHPAIDSGIPLINEAVNPILSDSFTPQLQDSVNPLQPVLFAAALIWITGMLVLLVHAAVSYIRLRRRVAASLPLGGRVYACDELPSPFILGILRPRIYVPSSLEGDALSCVKAHEQAHIRRRDHWWKPLGYLLLTVYWFQPLCWLAYVLLCRDIESACDEKVIRDMDDRSRAAYSQTLLACSSPRRILTVCPLAFGEVGVKQRVKNVLHYKKPAFRILLTAGILCAVCAVCFLTDPKDTDLPVPPETTGQTQTEAVTSAAATEQDPANEDVELAPSGTVKWYDWYHGDEMSWDGYRQIRLEEFPDSIFRASAGRLEVLSPEALVPAVICDGMPVGAVFFHDINGDGKREVCASVSYGSGVIDDHIVVCDLAGGNSLTSRQTWTVSGRMEYDFRFVLQDGKLLVEKNRFEDTALLPEKGEVVWKNGHFELVWYPVGPNANASQNTSLHPPFSTAAAYANYTEDWRACFPGALNAGLPARTSEDLLRLPVCRFDSRAELEHFRTAMQGLSTQGSWDEVPSLEALSASYDDAFFEQYSLLMTYVPASSSSYRYAVRDVSISQNSCCVSVYSLNDPRAGFNCLMAGWYLLTAVGKADLAGCTSFDAVYLPYSIISQ